MEIIALQQYTDKYVSLYEGEIRNISDIIAQQLIQKNIVAEHNENSGENEDNSILASFIDKTITEITVPESVTYIPTDAFYRLDLLKKIYLPNVKAIETQAFNNLGNLEEVYIGSSCTQIGEEMFGEYLEAFVSCSKNITINCGFAEGTVEYAPWGAINANINYNVPYKGEN